MRVLKFINNQRFNKKTMDKLRKLDKYDLSYITENLVYEGIFPPEQVYPIKLFYGRADITISRRLEHEFKHYMALKIIYPKLSFTPSRFVDMYWHLFILYTNEYQKFCTKLYGKALNHVPYVIETEQDHIKKNNTTSYEYTISTYEQLFGKIDKKIWPDITTIIKLYKKKNLRF